MCVLRWNPPFSVYVRLSFFPFNIIHSIFPQNSVSPSLAIEAFSSNCCFARHPPLPSQLSLQDTNALPVLGGGTSIQTPRCAPSTGAWHPQKIFEVHRSTHPLDIACSINMLQDIHQACLAEESHIVARLPWHQLLIVTSKDLRRLMSYSSPISDSIMTYYLEKLTKH